MTQNKTFDFIVTTKTELDILNEQFLNENILDCFIESGNITNATFVNVKIDDFEIYHCSFLNCSFLDCEFKNGLFSKCHFSNCVFQNTTFENLEFFRMYFDTSSQFKYCIFENLKLLRTYIVNCQLIETKWNNIVFTDSCFSNISCENVKFEALNFNSDQPLILTIDKQKKLEIEKERKTITNFQSFLKEIKIFEQNE